MTDPVEPAMALAVREPEFAALNSECRQLDIALNKKREHGRKLVSQLGEVKRRCAGLETVNGALHQELSACPVCGSSDLRDLRTQRN